MSLMMRTALAAALEVFDWLATLLMLLIWEVPLR